MNKLLSSWPLSLVLLLSATEIRANTYNYVVTTNTDLATTSGGSQVSLTTGDLRYVINAINYQGYGSSDVVNVNFNLPSGSNTISLGAILPPLNMVTAPILTIDGTNYGPSGGVITIDGANTYRGFFANQGQIGISNLTLQNCIAQGGDGYYGGAGLGGALFVNSGAGVGVQNVTFTGNRAKGGHSTGGRAQGGGGLGGSSATPMGSSSPTGGGGFSGDGGISYDGGLTLGGGGGGIADGGPAVTQAVFGQPNLYTTGGGGGGVIGANGGGQISVSVNTPTSGFAVALFPLWGGGGSGAGRAGAYLGAGYGGTGDGHGAGGPGGGGGGGGIGPTGSGNVNGGSAIIGGGGGGGGSGGNTPPFYTGHGGNGSTFGGGGGAMYGGNGGPFGGGGGGEGITGGGFGGNGGFGGGGGHGSGSSGASGWGAGSANAGGIGTSGGGASLGGAIFLARSGTSSTPGVLTIGSGVIFSGNTILSGAGAAVGPDIFIMTGTTLQFALNNGATTVNSIADDSAISLPGGGYVPGVGSGAGIVVTSNSSLTLAGTSTYIGGTIVDTNSTLTVTGSVYPRGSFLVTGGSTLDMSNASTPAIGNLAGNGTLIVGNTLNLYTTGAGATSLFLGTIQGTGAINQTGPGTLTLGGTNTHTGGTIVSSGTLSVNSDVNLGNTAGPLTVKGGATLSISGSGAITLNRPVTLSPTSNLTIPAGSSLTIAGILSGSGFTWSAPGTLTLTASLLNGTNTFTGATINGGTLAFYGDQDLGDKHSKIILNGATLQPLFLSGSGGGIITIASFVLGSGGGNISPNANEVLSIRYPITGSGALTHSGQGVLQFSTDGSVIGYTGGTIVNGGGKINIVTGGNLYAYGNVDLTNGSLFDIRGVSGGTAIGNLSGDASSTVNLEGKTLLFNTTGSSTFAGTMIGDSNSFYEITGSGTQNFTGTVIGTITVTSGITTINSLAQGNTSVGPDGTLKGIGSIRGVVFANGGIIYPGNSIGTMNVHGSFGATDAGGILAIEIDPYDSSRVVVGIDAGPGTADLSNFSLQILQNPGMYDFNQQYTIVTAEGGITGGFERGIQGGLKLGSYSSLNRSVVGSPGFSYDVEIVGNSAILYVTLNPVDADGVSKNASKTAQYLNQYSAAAVQTLIPLIGNPEAIDAALNSISPARNATGGYINQKTAFSLSNFVTSHIDGFRMYKNALNHKQVSYTKPDEKGNVSDAENPLLGLLTQSTDRVLATNLNSNVSSHQVAAGLLGKGNASVPLMADASSQAMPSGTAPTLDSVGYSGWISSFVQYAHQNAGNNNPAFHYLTETVMTGIDYRGVDQNILGGALGYLHSHFSEEQSAGSGDINNYYVSLYGNVLFDNFYLSPAVWGSFDQTHNKRNIFFPTYFERARANIYSWQLMPHLEVGYSVGFDWGDIVPFTEADWAINWQRSYSETGAAPFNMTQKAKTSSMVHSETGLKFLEIWDRSWGAMMLKEKISYVFEKPFGTGTVDAAIVGSPGSFTVSSLNSPVNLASFGFEVLVAVGKKRPISLKLGYEGEIGSRYWSNELNLILSKQF